MSFDEVAVHWPVWCVDACQLGDVTVANGALDPHHNLSMSFSNFEIQLFLILFANFRDEFTRLKLKLKPVFVAKRPIYDLLRVFEDPVHIWEVLLHF